MLGICTSVPENFSETKFCWIIQVDDVINRAKYFFNRITRVSLARGQTSPFSVQTVDGRYNCCTTVTTVVLPNNCDTLILILAFPICYHLSNDTQCQTQGYWTVDIGRTIVLSRIQQWGPTHVSPPISYHPHPYPCSTMPLPMPKPYIFLPSPQPIFPTSLAPTGM